jgi:iron complex transport system permease protein
MRNRVFERTDHSVRRTTIRLFGERASFLIDLKGAALCAILACAALFVGVFSLTSGTYPISLASVLTSITSHDAGGDEMIRMIVIEWRLPRVALAFLLGTALGLSGAIFQSLTRNPLGSPDIIGFSAGSYAGALAVLLLFSGGYYETAAGALVGGIATASSVYLLAWRRGIHGFRLIIVGIGVAAMLSAFNTWMIREAELQVAMCLSSGH